jgi:hypothetical protein
LVQEDQQAAKALSFKSEPRSAVLLLKHLPSVEKTLKFLSHVAQLEELRLFSTRRLQALFLRLRLLLVVLK